VSPILLVVGRPMGQDESHRKVQVTIVLEKWSDTWRCGGTLGVERKSLLDMRTH